MLTTRPIECPAAFAAALRAKCPSGVPPQTVADGVAHGATGDPVETLADVGGRDAVCAQYAMPDGVAF